MDIKQLREKSPTDLGSQLLELRKEQFSLRMQKGTGQLPQTHQIKRVKRDIARIKTVLGERI